MADIESRGRWKSRWLMPRTLALLGLFLFVENTACAWRSTTSTLFDAESEIEDDGLPKVHHLLESMPWKERSCSPLSASPAYSGPHNRWLDLAACEAAMAWARLWSRVTPHPINNI